MSVLLGFGPDSQSSAGLELAGQIARSCAEDLVLCCVVHDSLESPSLRDRVDVGAEWRRHLQEQARATLADLREKLPEGITATRVEEVVRTARSVPHALEQEGRARQARMLVVGSSTHGAFGHIALGSTSDRLVHSSQLPVALAPRGYRSGGEPVRRLVLAVDPTAADVRLSTAVRDLAAAFGCPVEIVTFAVRGRAVPGLGGFTDESLWAHWVGLVREAQAEIAAALGHPDPTDGGAAGQLVQGERWSTVMEAYPWRTGDVLAVGSSRHGALSRVFLGSTATRILRHAPVPVVLMPRG